MKGADFNRMEKDLARKDGAKLVKNSGRGFVKGDASLPGLLIDYKFTEAKSFAVNVKDFIKHEKDAWIKDNQAVVVAVFTEFNNKQLGIMDWDYLKEIHELYQKYKYLEDE